MFEDSLGTVLQGAMCALNDAVRLMPIRSAISASDAQSSYRRTYLASIVCVENAALIHAEEVLNAGHNFDRGLGPARIGSDEIGSPVLNDEAVTLASSTPSARVLVRCNYDIVPSKQLAEL